MLQHLQILVEVEVRTCNLRHLARATGKLLALTADSATALEAQRTSGVTVVAPVPLTIERPTEAVKAAPAATLLPLAAAAPTATVLHVSKAAVKAVVAKVAAARGTPRALRKTTKQVRNVSP